MRVKVGKTESWTVYRQPVYRQASLSTSQFIDRAGLSTSPVYRKQFIDKYSLSTSTVYRQVQFIDKSSLSTNTLWKIDFRQNNTVIQSKEYNNGFINIYTGLFINLKLIIYCLKYIVN